jgi:AraC-like DNA-binding protein
MSAPRSGAATQRLGAAAELPALLRELGIDPATVFAGSGLDPATLSPSTHAPLGATLALLERAARAADCAHIGLLTGLRFNMAHHGAIGELMRTAPTLRDALADYVSWQHGYSTGAIVYLVRLGDELALGFGVHASSAVVSHHVYEFVVAVGVRMVAELSGGRVQPVDVHLSRRAPEPGSPHARLLKCQVKFNQPLNCLIFDRVAMRTPLASHDPAARRALMAQMEARMVAGAGHAGQVRRAIRRALLEEAPKMPEIAHDLGIHPRTLRRRLSEEGTTFDDLLDDVRQTVARELIELTDMPLGEIGDALAFASPGVFSQWFRRAFGMPPSLWPRQPHRWTAES